MTRYSAASVVAGKTMHPVSTTGSIEAYWLTARVTGLSTAVHGRKCGSVPLLHAAPQATVNSDRSRRCFVRTSHRSIMNLPCNLTGARASERPTEADRPGQLVHTYHRDHERFQRHIPLWERAPENGSECDRQSTLRH